MTTPEPARRSGLTRRLSLTGAVALLLGTAWPGRAAALAPGFDDFLAGLWPEAHRHGVSRVTFDAAFAGVTPDPTVIEKTHRQAEFVKPLGDYLASAVSEKRIATGRAMAQDWQRWTAKAEATYGVDRYIVLGVWGLETNFGGFAGDDYVVRSLATLAFVHYRGDYFRRELIAALQILQAGHVDPAHMKGSWAGAMGQTQFMPSNFATYAVDFEGTGRRDIWTSVPDAIGSTANFLRKHGWRAGETWGYEVQLPPGLPRHSTPTQYEGFAHWAACGVQRADGGPMPATGKAGLLMPAGAEGPGLPGHAELQGDQELQQLDRLCAGRGAAGRPHRRLGPAQGAVAHGLALKRPQVGAARRRPPL